MEKSFTLIQTIATAGAFSAISFWYVFAVEIPIQLLRLLSLNWCLVNVPASRGWKEGISNLKRDLVNRQLF
nr:hypothetical protein CFP56_67286 [Quercus suber]